MRRPRLLVALTVAAVMAAACGGGEQGPDPATAPTPGTPSGTTAAQPTSPSPTSSGPPSAGSSANPLLAFQAEQVTGGTYDAGQLSGRDVAIWFWAPW